MPALKSPLQRPHPDQLAPGIPRAVQMAVSRNTAIQCALIVEGSLAEIAMSRFKRRSERLVACDSARPFGEG